MRLGRAELDLISDGTFRMDGGTVYGVVPKAIWGQLQPADRKNRIEVGLNCLLIRTGGKNVLVDTGLGTKHGARARRIFAMKAGKLVSNLARIGLQPADIDLVVLTHLHFDHVGGCTQYNRQNQLEPVFPRAIHLVQRQDWIEATETNERTRPAYVPEDFLPLEEARQLELLDGDAELLPGLWVRRTGGHTAGHQIVHIESEGQQAACMGDVVPTLYQLPVHYMTSFEMFPLETVETKRRWLGQAEQERWLLIFGHGTGQKAGRIVRREGRIALNPVNMESPDKLQGDN